MKTINDLTEFELKKLEEFYYEKIYDKTNLKFEKLRENEKMCLYYTYSFRIYLINELYSIFKIELKKSFEKSFLYRAFIKLTLK